MFADNGKSSALPPLQFLPRVDLKLRIKTAKPGFPAAGTWL